MNYMKVPVSRFSLRWKCVHGGSGHQCDALMHDAMTSNMPRLHEGCGWVHVAELSPQDFKEMERLNADARTA